MNTVDQLKLAVWIIPVVFGAGGFVSMMSASSSGLSKDLEAVQSEISDHQAKDSHPVTAARLEVVIDEQRELRSSMAEANENIAAICAATKSRCK
tara:strand:- start:3452 stop:3736 length:285 start_codon:yes stop_codon:yes gene_type:complete